MDGMRPTVLIVDDNARFRAAAHAMLDAEGFDVVGEAADGETGVEQCRVLRPDVVLLDIQLPTLDGFDVAVQLAAADHPPTVVLTSTLDASAYGARLVDAPAPVFLPKRDLSGRTLADALRSA